MFVFRKIWRALLSCYLCFEIRPFALLPTIYSTLGRLPEDLSTYMKHNARNFNLVFNHFDVTAVGSFSCILWSSFLVYGFEFNVVPKKRDKTHSYKRSLIPDCFFGELKK